MNRAKNVVITPMPQAKSRVIRRRRNGRDEIVKNSASAKNARVKGGIATKRYLKALRYNVTDRRTRAYKSEQALIGSYVSHFGGLERCSAPMRALIQQAARLELCAGLAWRELVKANRVGTEDGYAATGTFQAFLSAAKAQRDLLLQLGIDSPVFDSGTAIRDMTDEELEAIARGKYDSATD